MRKGPCAKKALEKKEKRKKGVENFHAWFRWGCLSTQSTQPGSATEKHFYITGLQGGWGGGGGVA